MAKKSETTITKEGVVEYLKEKYGEAAKAAKLTVDRKAENFGMAINNSFAYGDLASDVQTLADYHALRRIRAAYITDDKSVPTDVAQQLEAAEQAKKKLQSAKAEEASAE